MNEKLVRGSIRVFKDACFYKERETQYVHVAYEELTAEIRTTAIPKDLATIFKRTGIKYSPMSDLKLKLRGEIKDLDFDGFKPDKGEDKLYLRMAFSGITETELRSKLITAKKWLVEHNVEHGEKDGKVACIFKCLTSEQLEMNDF